MLIEEHPSVAMPAACTTCLKTRCKSSPSPRCCYADSVTSTSAKSGSGSTSLPAGAIAGIAVGAVALLALLGISPDTQIKPDDVHSDSPMPPLDLYDVLLAAK